MANSNEEILQVISLFRHGARNTFMNLDTHERYSADLCDDKIINTINKGRHFVNKYFNAFSPSPFNDNDIKCFFSYTTRTIKTLIYRFSDFLPKDDFKSMSQEELKEFAIKNFPNAKFEASMFKYDVSVACKYYSLDPDYSKLLNELEKEIGQQSQAALELYKKYTHKPEGARGHMDNYMITFIYDFLFNVKPEVQKTFTNEQLIIKDVMGKLKANKRMMDINLSNPNSLKCNVKGILECFYKEMTKIKENAEDKKKIIIISGHDINLACLIGFLETDKSKYYYNFDDEINCIVFKKPNDEKLYVKFEYNILV